MLHYLLKFSMIQLLLVGLIAVLTEVQAEPLYYFCSNVTTFARNSTYQTNRATLLTHLTSNATSSTGFYNASVGQVPNEVNGLFLCRGDVSTTDCRSCVASASQEIVQLCPDDIWAIAWYDYCLLRYSNESIVSTVDGDPAVFMWNSANITTDQARFNRLVASSMNDTATMAASTPSVAKKFAVNQTDFNGFQTLYSLAQCTPDLSSSQCDICLRQAIGQLPSCCLNKQGGRVLLPSCNVRYEVYLFFNATALPTAPPPPSLETPPPPISVTRPKGKSGISSAVIVAIVVASAASAVLFWLVFCFLSRRRTKEYHPTQEDDVANDDITTTGSLQFDFGTLAAATNNFSADNKLGEGGFGEVYKGSLPNGKDIAVKRLSRGSGQGAEQFKTEAALVANLQHRNLVRLLGFCVEGEEKILVYEFVPNKSLDYFLFDPEKQPLLDWSRRYKIIGGIARGILYLHEDSRLRIIHRDLKASNVLLDADMNAKISDFGTARIFGVDQTQGNTNRIVGTYGYMSPEYAMHGQFSVKSDAYSFGVLVLEIISGKKNSSFYRTEGCEDLLSYVWKHWRDGTPLEVLDPLLRDTYSRNEVVRCLHIGLLCVQEDPVNRPSMAQVVLMLNSYSVTLPQPQEPAFFINSRTEKGFALLTLSSESAGQSTGKATPCSVDETMITEVYPR